MGDGWRPWLGLDWRWDGSPGISVLLSLRPACWVLGSPSDFASSRERVRGRRCLLSRLFPRRLLRFRPRGARIVEKSTPLSETCMDTFVPDGTSGASTSKHVGLTNLAGIV